MVQQIKDVLKNSKTVAMVGVSSLKKKRRSKKFKEKAFNHCNEVYARFWLQGYTS